MYDRHAKQVSCNMLESSRLYVDSGNKTVRIRYRSVDNFWDVNDRLISFVKKF